MKRIAFLAATLFFRTQSFTLLANSQSKVFSSEHFKMCVSLGDTEYDYQYSLKNDSVLPMPRQELDRIREDYNRFKAESVAKSGCYTGLRARYDDIINHCYGINEGFNRFCDSYGTVTQDKADSDFFVWTKDRQKISWFEDVARQAESYLEASTDQLNTLEGALQVRDESSFEGADQDDLNSCEQSYVIRKNVNIFIENFDEFLQSGSALYKNSSSKMPSRERYVNLNRLLSGFNKSLEKKVGENVLLFKMKCLLRY